MEGSTVWFIVFVLFVVGLVLFLIFGPHTPSPYGVHERSAPTTSFPGVRKLNGENTNKMSFLEYQELAQRTTAELEPEIMNHLHYLMGMMTDIGELMDVYKKWIAYGKPRDIVNEKEEIGDLMWYLANFCRINGYNLEEIMKTNIEKLRARYPEKFDAELANSRNLDVERAILEK